MLMTSRFYQPLSGSNRQKVVLLTGFVELADDGSVVAASSGHTETLTFGTLTKTGTGEYTFTLSDQYYRILFPLVSLCLTSADAEANIEAHVVDVPGNNGVAAGKELKIVTREAGSSATKCDNTTTAKTLYILIVATEARSER